MRNSRCGLTLIELLVIILVILTLLLVATPPLLSARLRAEVARVQQDMQVVESALEWYYLDHKRYPESSGSDLVSTNSGSRASANRIGKGLLRLSENEYLEYLPEDRFIDATKIYRGAKVYQFGSSGIPPGASAPRAVPAWILVSPGPDKITDSQAIGDFPFGTISWQYDPTNGLKSEGDIVRLGGDWQLGDWYLDGQRIRAPESGE
jgi:type II secretory pathway pseudopilin PulG